MFYASSLFLLLTLSVFSLPFCNKFVYKNNLQFKQVEKFCYKTTRYLYTKLLMWHLYPPCMVARVLLLMRAGLSALPRPPGARLSRAPLKTQTRLYWSVERSVQFSEIHRSNNWRTWTCLNMSNTNPGVNWEEAISPGLSPAAAAIAAMLVGNWAPCSAADSPEATITWPVPKEVAMDVGAWVTMVCAWMPALLSAVVDWILVGDGLNDGELATVVTIGAVDMTDAVFVAPTVVPLEKGGSSGLI